MKEFQDKVAVITGAASGIGRAIAEKCVEKKLKVVLADINPNTLQQCEHELKKISTDVMAVVTDVSRESDIKNLCDETLHKFGKVNLLFNHAGIPGPIAPIWEGSSSDIEHLVASNLMSVVYGLKTFIPIMLKQGDACYIVNTASGAGLHTMPLMSGYIMTKHAVVALSEVLFFDLKNQQANINVSVLCPGMVATHFADTLVMKDDDSKEVKELITNFKSELPSRGSPAKEIVDSIFHAIEANQFYILPHISDHRVLIKNRMENMLNCKNPIWPPD